jgi:hypothetical protein
VALARRLGGRAQRAEHAPGDRIVDGADAADPVTDLARRETAQRTQLCWSA